MKKIIWIFLLWIFVWIGINFVRYNNIGYGLYIDRFSNNLVTSYFFWGKKLVIENIDVGSFRKLSTWWEYWFFKDRNHVYYIGNTTQCLGCLIPKERNIQWYILSWVNPNTFSILNTRFIKDDDQVLFRIIPEYRGAILESFQEITWINARDTQVITWTVTALNESFIHDNKAVYFLDSNTLQVLTWADSASFTIINFKYFKDKSHTYELINWKILTHSWDLQILGMVYNHIYTKDKNHVYHRCLYENECWTSIVPWADPDSYEVGERGPFMKDKSHVYYLYRDQDTKENKIGIVDWADVLTFDITEVHWKDKYSTYILRDGYIFKDGIKLEHTVQNYTQ